MKADKQSRGAVIIGKSQGWWAEYDYQKQKTRSPGFPRPPPPQPQQTKIHQNPDLRWALNHLFGLKRRILSTHTGCRSHAAPQAFGRSERINEDWKTFRSCQTNGAEEGVHLPVGHWKDEVAIKRRKTLEVPKNFPFESRLRTNEKRGRHVKPFPHQALLGLIFHLWPEKQLKPPH